MDEYPIIPGISDGILVEIVKSGLVDRVMAISNEDAVEMAHELAKKEGMFCGMSSGANMAAALRFAEELGPGKRIVVILPDSRDRYLVSETYTT
jgi:cysteine synthase A